MQAEKKNIEEHSDVSKPAEITSQVFGYFFKIDKEEQCKRFSWILATQVEFNPDSIGSPEERCIRKEKQQHSVRIAPKPFSKGAMRYAYAMFMDTTDAKLVAKVYASKSAKYKSEEKVVKGMGMGHSHIKRKRAAYHAVACQIALRGGLSDIPWVQEFQLDVRKSMHAENSLRPAPPSGPPPWHLY